MTVVIDPGSDWRTYDSNPLPRILQAALGIFAERGYHGTSIRDIAAAAGLSVPGLYHHYKSKQDILVDLMMSTMDELQGRADAALSTAGAQPGAEFEVLIENLLRFHMYRQQQALVSSTEIRSLDPDRRPAYVARRDRVQTSLETAIQRGVADGVFGTEHPKDAARAVASMCVGVSSWYRPDGPLSPEELIGRYLHLARSLVR